MLLVVVVVVVVVVVTLRMGQSSWDILHTVTLTKVLSNATRTCSLARHSFHFSC